MNSESQVEVKIKEKSYFVSSATELTYLTFSFNKSTATGICAFIIHHSTSSVKVKKELADTAKISRFHGKVLDLVLKRIFLLLETLRNLLDTADSIFQVHQNDLQVLYVCFEVFVAKRVLFCSKIPLSVLLDDVESETAFASRHNNLRKLQG